MGVIYAIVSFLVGDIERFLFLKAWSHESFLIEKPDQSLHLREHSLRDSFNKKTTTITKKVRKRPTTLYNTTKKYLAPVGENVDDN
jgi:hypothetical protein